MAAEVDELYKAYEEHAKTLRTWLVAYGIGAPVVFLTNEQLSKRLLGNPWAWKIAALFLAGVSVQVFLAAINKTANWGAYYARRNPAKATGKRFVVARWLSEQFWIDLCIYTLTLGAFAVGTYYLFSLLMVAI